jgi:hypothetical protein
MILRIPKSIIDKEARLKEARWKDAPPEVVEALRAIDEWRARPENHDDGSEDELAELKGLEEITGRNMYALLEEDVKRLGLRVRHGKAELPGIGWAPVLIAKTEQDLKQEIKRRRNVRKERARLYQWFAKFALQHPVTEATSTLTDSRAI